MKRRFAVCCSTALVGLLAGCSGSAPTANTAAEIKALKDTEVQWNKDYESKDAAKLAAHYTEDAILMAPGEPAAKGKGAISKALADMVADPALKLSFATVNVEISKAGDLGYTQGTFTMTMTDPATKKVVNSKGTYLTVYRKGPDGTWKAVQDAAIPDAQPVAAETPKAAPASHPAAKKKAHKKK